MLKWWMLQVTKGGVNSKLWGGAPGVDETDWHHDGHQEEGLGAPDPESAEQGGAQGQGEPAAKVHHWPEAQRGRTPRTLATLVAFRICLKCLLDARSDRGFIIWRVNCWLFSSALMLAILSVLLHLGFYLLSWRFLGLIDEKNLWAAGQAARVETINFVFISSSLLINILKIFPWDTSQIVYVQMSDVYHV